jgi:cell division protein FtsX
MIKMFKRLNFILPSTHFCFSGAIVAVICFENRWFDMEYIGQYPSMVFNANFNNISVIPWQSVLLVDETVVPGENHQPVASHFIT